MKRSGTSSAAADETAAPIDRVPKVRLDVLTSRLLHEQDYEALSSSSLSSSLASDSVSVSDRTAGTATTAASSSYAAVPRMPLAALARAEAQLRRPLTLANGGLTADFTAEDIGHITDAAVLRCLAGSDTPRPPSAPVNEMEARMAALQHEIDTFITAVDNEGRSYDIRLGPSGHRQILIADEEVDEVGDEESAKDVQEALQLQPSTPTVPDVSPRTAGDAPSSAPPTTSSARHTQSQKQRRPTAERSARTGRVPNRFAPAPPPARASVSRVAAAAPPAVTVRPQAGLTTTEEERVEALLDESVFGALSTHNPFTTTTELVARFAALQEQISRYVAARGGQAEPAPLLHLPPPSTAGAAASSPPATTAAEMGNIYMREARQHAEAAQRLRRVNARLQALQQRSEALALAPAEDTPSDLVALRPLWAQSPADAIDEAEVQRLLAEARAEEERAREVGLTSTAITSADPFTGLRDQLQSAGRRAVELLAAYDACPPALREAPALADDDAADASVSGA